MIVNCFFKSNLISKFTASLILSPTTNACATICTNQIRYAGHSHWKNIKHTKELNDSLRQKIILDVVRRIKVAVALNGGITNPKLNAPLFKVLEDGKLKDVPSATMTAALLRLEKGKNRKGAIHFYEGRVLGGCSLIIETNTDRPKHTKGEIQHILKKFAGTVVDGGLCTHLFNYKGVIYVAPSEEGDAVQLDADKAVEVAVEAGAEEVLLDFDEDGNTSYKFLAEPKELHNVKRELEKLKLRPYEARLEYIPHTFVKLESDIFEYVPKMVDLLKNIEAVVNVYDNITTS